MKYQAKKVSDLNGLNCKLVKETKVVWLLFYNIDNNDLTQKRKIKELSSDKSFTVFLREKVKVKVEKIHEGIWVSNEHILRINTDIVETEKVIHKVN